MPPYQPPHLRDRPPVAQQGTVFRNTEPSLGPRSADRQQVGTPTGPPAPPGSRSGPPMRHWCGTVPPQSSRPVLASPAGDLRPSIRSNLHSRPKGQEDDMEFIQSVSRSGGDGAEGDALKDWGLQERYRRYIDERLDKHYKTFPGPRDRPPPAGATDRLESLSSIVLLFRKLREGVVASGRIDDFAIEVFESSARTAILAHNIPQVISSLSGLVPGLYQAVDVRRPSSQDDPLRDLSQDLVKLQLESAETSPRSDIRATFASLLLLFHLCQSDSPSMYHTTLNDLTRPISHPLRPRARDGASYSDTPPETPHPFLPPTSPALTLPRRIHHILSTDRFDPITFWRLLADPGVSGPEKTIISWASERVRERAWQVMRKCYLEIGVEWAAAWVGIEVGGVGGVEEVAGQRGLRVEGRTIKLR